MAPRVWIPRRPWAPANGTQAADRFDLAVTQIRSKDTARDTEPVRASVPSRCHEPSARVGEDTAATGPPRERLPRGVPGEIEVAEAPIRVARTRPHPSRKIPSNVVTKTLAGSDRKQAHIASSKRTRTAQRARSSVGVDGEPLDRSHPDRRPSGKGLGLVASNAPHRPGSRPAARVPGIESRGGLAPHRERGDRIEELLFGNPVT